MIQQARKGSSAVLEPKQETEADKLVGIVEDYQRRIDANWMSEEIGPFPDDAITLVRISNFRDLANFLVELKQESGKRMAEVVATAAGEPAVREMFPFTSDALEVLNKHFNK